MHFVQPDRYAALKATGRLISPKGIALAIIRMLQRDDYRIADLVQLVQTDPAIAGRILYMRLYTIDPAKRGPGFGLQAVAVIVLYVAALIGVLRAFFV